MEDKFGQVIGECVDFLMLLPAFSRDVGVPTRLMSAAIAIFCMIAATFRTIDGAVIDAVAIYGTTCGALEEFFGPSLKPTYIADSKILL